MLLFVVELAYKHVLMHAALLEMLLEMWGTSFNNSSIALQQIHYICIDVV